MYLLLGMVKVGGGESGEGGMVKVGGGESAEGSAQRLECL